MGRADAAASAYQSDSDFTRKLRFEQLQKLIVNLAEVDKHLLKLGASRAATPAASPVGTPRKADEQRHMELSEAKVEDVKKEEDSKQEAAGQPAGEPEPPTEDAPDWDADEDEMEDLPQKHAAEAAQVLADQLRGGQAEELSRLLDLLSELKAVLGHSGRPD
jgi:hypothetical protein